MLVLSRKRSEGIRIGDEIRIVVVKIERHAIRLGIEAPSHVSIVREELTLDLASAERECPALDPVGRA